MRMVSAVRAHRTGESGEARTDTFIAVDVGVSCGLEARCAVVRGSKEVRVCSIHVQSPLVPEIPEPESLCVELQVC